MSHFNVVLCMTEAQRKHYANNREKMIERAKQWQRDHPERAKELARQSQARRLGRSVSHVRGAPVRYPDSHKHVQDRKHFKLRRERMAFTEDSDVTKAKLAALRSATTVCEICGVPVTAEEVLHKDHIDSLFAGGPHMMANIRYVHPKCNARRPRWLEYCYEVTPLGRQLFKDRQKEGQ